MIDKPFGKTNWQVSQIGFGGWQLGGTWGEVNETNTAIKDECAPHYANLAEAALRYALQPQAVTLTIPGMRNRKEVDLNTIHSDGYPFPERLAHSLRPHGWKHLFS